MGKSYNNRSLTPRVPKGQQTGSIQYRIDGLVYIEEHATDPGKVVFYYADDMGKVNTAREMPRSAYEDLMKGMSEADQAMLGRIAGSYQSEINALRAEREYDRLDAIAKELTRLRAQRQEVASSRTYHFAEGGNFKRVKQIDDQIAALEREADRTILDMSRNEFGKEASLRDMFKWSQGTPKDKKSIVKGTLSYKERSLMPEIKGEAPHGVFEPRSDGLVYMEADAADPTKAIFYYADDSGKVIAREISMKEYGTFVQGLKEEEKGVLQQAARVYEREISALRQEREYDRLADLGRQIEAKEQYAAYLKGKGQARQEIKSVEAEIKGLKKEVERTIDDMVSNQFGSRRGITELYNNMQGSAIKPQAGRARLVVSDNVEEAFAQLEEIGKRIEALEAQRVRITGSGPVTKEKLTQVRGIESF